MTGWHPNPGFAPIWKGAGPDEHCPADRIPPGQARDARVFVRLRGGIEPPASWPVLAQDWALGGSDFDIVEWRRA